MNFIQTPLAGAFVIELVPMQDERGSFARTFCRREFEAQGLDPTVAQCNVSHNVKRGTLRGMHLQDPPHEEAKLVRCVRGAIWDAIIDLRAGSATRGKWFGVELSEKNLRQLFVPAGFAHGFQTLSDDTVVFYQMSNFYAAEAASGVPYDDPAFGIEWPLPVAEISPKDKTWPAYVP